MGEIIHGATVSVALIRVLLKHLAETGVNTTEFIEAAGLEPSIIENPDARVSMGRFHSLWRRAAQMSGGGNFGPRIGREIAKGYFGGNILYSIMMNCPSVGDAMDKFFRYHDIMEDAIQPKMRLKGSLAFLSWESFNPAIETPGSYSEALLGAYIHILRHITENNLNLVEARFAHPRPADVEEHKRLFQSPLFFERPKNELVVEKSFLEAPIFLASPELLVALERFAEKLLDKRASPDAWSDKVTR
ncbi:MAG: AraC family transcriptional regulator, partial [Desulfobacterales bacterium]|nr:AraC family transcriptional regulator [Desulfobacterales bacterium]